MARVALPESGLRARRRRRRLFFIVGVWALCMSVVVGAIALSRAPFMRIQTIEVQGANTVAKEALEARARGVLKGAYLYLVPRDNIFVYPKENLSASLLAAYPTLREVSVSAQNFSTIEIAAEDRQPRALWCGERPALAEPCLLLDEDGTVYTSAPDFSENPYVRYYGALGERKLPAPFLDAESFRALAALVDALAQAQYPLEVESVSVDGVGDAHLQFVNGFTVLFALHDDGGDVFERFSLALTAEPFKNSSLNDFEYLDLRFGDKLYYKLKAQEVGEMENAPTEQ